MDIVGVGISLAVTGIASLGSGWWCINMFKKARYLLDTPTSKVRSAAQGYVELYGVLKDSGAALNAPLSAQPCVWWSFTIEEQVLSSKNRRWQQLEKGSSIGLLCLNDGTGDCLIDPRGAQVIPMIKQVWYGSTRHPLQAPAPKNILQTLLSGTKRYRYSEQRLHANQPLYAIGDFVTRGGGQEVFDLAATRATIIRTWKEDFDGLLRRFDRDRNGQLDENEWQKVREAAEVEAHRVHRQRSTQPAQHFLRQPQENQPFILSNYGEDEIAQRWYWQAIFAGCICIASSVVLVSILNTYF